MVNDGKHGSESTAPILSLATAPVVAADPLDLEKLFRRWIEYIDVRPQSVETYTKAIRQFLKWMQDQKIVRPQRGDILAYRRFLETDKKPATVQLYIIAVRQFFKWLQMEGIYKNIAEHIKSAKVERYHKKDYLASNQIKTVLNAIDRSTEQGARDYAMLLLMVTGGLRAIEVSRVNVEDIRAVGDDVRLYLHSKGKDEKVDYVKLPQPVETAIREYLHRRGRSPAPLFISAGNRHGRERRMTTRSISRIAKDRLRAAGYDSDKISAHSLRHTAVTLALMGGQSLQDVQTFARHTNITTTMIYAHNVDRANNKCAETIAAAVC